MLVRHFGKDRRRRPQNRRRAAAIQGVGSIRSREAAKEIESLADDTVEITGWVPREQLIELYRCALGFIYPSTFEGFGMPVLEAMAAGVPVACSDIPPLREIARSTVHFFDPASDREIRDALLLLASGKLSTEAAQRRAAQFTWEKTARATLDYLNKCSS